MTIFLICIATVILLTTLLAPYKLGIPADGCVGIGLLGFTIAIILVLAAVAAK
jgi:hypothetical protein